MARTLLTVYEIARGPTGILEPPPQAFNIAEGMYIPSNRGYTQLRITNTGAGSLSVGAQIEANEVDEIPIPNKGIDIPPGSVAWFGPFPPEFYNQEFDTDPYAVLIDIDAGAGPATVLASRNR